MKKQQSSFVCSLLAVVLVFTVLAGSVRAVYAESGVRTWKNEIYSMEVYGSCTDPDGFYEATFVSNGTVRHYDEDNGLKFHWTEYGTYTVVPIDADSSVTYSGIYNIEVQNQLSDKHFLYHFGFTDTALGSDGTREVMQARMQILITPTGVEHDIDDFRWFCK